MAMEWYEFNIASDDELTRDEYLLVTGVTPDDKQPTTWASLKGTALYQNYPNPFNPETWIPYALEDDAQVSILIYSAAGQLVRILDLGLKPSGMYISKDKAIYWDGCDDSGQAVASGIYFYTLKAGSFQAAGKMAVAR